MLSGLPQTLILISSDCEMIRLSHSQVKVSRHFSIRPHFCKLCLQDMLSLCIHYTDIIYKTIYKSLSICNVLSLILCTPFPGFVLVSVFFFSGRGSSWICAVVVILCSITCFSAVSTSAHSSKSSSAHSVLQLLLQPVKLTLKLSSLSIVVINANLNSLPNSLSAFGTYSKRIITHNNPLSCK